MFPTRKRIFHLHLGGKVIPMSADHPLYVEGNGRVNAGDMPGAKVEGEHEFVSNLRSQPCRTSPALALAPGRRS
jgi:hypothetical protein